jgi:hypothetical protein
MRAFNYTIHIDKAPAAVFEFMRTSASHPAGATSCAASTS